jgi:phage replication-related protein YjqB (UPF0714/DUF867 family)
VATEDKYKNFAELSANEIENTDYRIELCRRKSPVAIIAPHGGRIEAGTSEIALAIAGIDYNLYLFEGIKPKGNADLHITSTQFDEPRCVKLVGHCSVVIAIHGMEGSNIERVRIGGLAEALREKIRASLEEADFSAEIAASGDLAGVNPDNICNRGFYGAGVQLEISRGLRDRVMAEQTARTGLAKAIRQAINATSVAISYSR